jgi:hypothetical protein
MNNELTSGEVNTPLMERVELIKTLADIARGGFGEASTIATKKLIEQLNCL